MKLTDFGVAKALGQSYATVTGELKGKMAYMSPEQLQAGFAPIDRRSDIFGLGCVLYEITTGHRPFEADSPAAVVHRILNAKASRPRALDPTYPPDLESIVMTAIAHRPDERFSTADEMRVALGVYLAKREAITASDVAQLVGERYARDGDERRERSGSPAPGAAPVLPTATCRSPRRRDRSCRDRSCRDRSCRDRSCRDRSWRACPPRARSRASVHRARMPVPSPSARRARRRARSRTASSPRASRPRSGLPRAARPRASRRRARERSACGPRRSRRPRRPPASLRRPRGRVRRSFSAGGVMLAVVAAGGAFMARGKTRTVATVTPPPLPASNASSAVTGAPSEPGRPASSRVSFHVLPKDAMMLVDGVLMPAGATAVDRPANGTRRVVFRAEKFEDYVEVIDPGTPAALDITLSPRGASVRHPAVRRPVRPTPSSSSSALPNPYDE